MAPELIPHEEALRRLVLPPLPDSEAVPLARALGRWLTQDLVSTTDVPAFDNAAVDGYALTPTHRQRVVTGMALPQGTQTVVPEEDTQAPPGANIRRRGEDVAKGDVVLRAGRRLRPQDLAAAASLGMEALTCRRQVRVAVFSTGRELRRTGQARGDAGVYDCNRVMLLGLLQALPVTAHDGGILSGNAAEIGAAVATAATRHDAVITSGGAGRSEEDFARVVLQERGEALFQGVAIKPGRPLCAGLLNGVPWLALPGNPVAAMVCFLVYGRPLLARLGGGEESPARWSLPAAHAMQKKAGRTEFRRGMVRDGAVAPFPRQGAGIVRSLREADGLIELPQQVTEVSEGQQVWFRPWGMF